MKNGHWIQIQCDKEKEILRWRYIFIYDFLFFVSSTEFWFSAHNNKHKNIQKRLIFVVFWINFVFVVVPTRDSTHTRMNYLALARVTVCAT